MANVQVYPPIRGNYDEIWANEITRRINQLLSGNIVLDSYGIDGGDAAAVYLTTQSIDGGGA